MQQCLLGLQQGGELDDYCPNVKMHQKGGDGRQHPINTKVLVKLLRTQLDGNIDYNCTPFGDCGGYGAPFKITCTAYGYTVVGKGTTSRLWKEVSHEAEIQYTKSFGEHRVSQYLSSLEQSVWPRFISFTELARFATCCSWLGEVKAQQSTSSGLYCIVRSPGQWRKSVPWESYIGTLGRIIFCGTKS